LIGAPPSTVTLPDVAEHPVEPLTVDEANFRRVAARFTTGISVAATRHADVDHAMTVSAFTSVSLDPLLVLICVEKITRFHQAVLASGLWTVSVLAEDDEEMSRWFALNARPTGGQLADYAHHPGAKTGMPVLDAAMAVIECQTRAIYDGGDHSIVLGDVVGLDLDPAARRPLLYFEGNYRQLR
jgi:flavin reductase (DIM6/NTAB) family NADH-FMN oxidoreductase RutF